MSRGAGSLQERVMSALESAGGAAGTASLREHFPREARNKSLFRAIRSLQRMGAVEVFEEGPCGPRAKPGRTVVLNFGFSRSDRELVRQTEELCRWVAWLARERGVPVPEEVRKGLRDLKTARGRSSGR